MACSGSECRIKLVNILTNPIQPNIVPVPANPPPALNAWATKQDMATATAALLAAINAWARATSTACEQPALTAVPYIPCICRQTENPDWTKAVTLTDDFRHAFTSRNRGWEAQATVQYQVAFVAGFCSEPPGTPKYMASAGTIEGHGLVVLAAGDTALTPEMLEKIKGALG